MTGFQPTVCMPFVQCVLHACYWVFKTSCIKAYCILSLVFQECSSLSSYRSYIGMYVIPEIYSYFSWTWVCSNYLYRISHYKFDLISHLSIVVMYVRIEANTLYNSEVFCETYSNNSNNNNSNFISTHLFNYYR